MHNAAIVSLWVGNVAIAAGLGYWLGQIVHRSSGTKGAALRDAAEGDTKGVLEELETDLAWFDDDCSHATIDLEEIAEQVAGANVAGTDLRETIERFVKAGRLFERRLERSQTRCSRMGGGLGGLWTQLTRSVSVHRDFVGRQCTRLEQDASTQPAESPSAPTVLLATIRSLADRNRLLREELDQLKRQLLDRESRLVSAQRDARVDSLTHLANRRAFEERLEACQSQAERQHEKYALVVFDLDRFKLINDQFGHPFGDAILAVFGRILAEAVRTSDVAARFGGEEFVILLPGADATAAFSVAERCRRQAEKSVVRRGDIASSFTVSGGVAAWVEGMTSAEVIEAADQALYYAKSEGRNRVRNASDAVAEGNLLVSAAGT